MSTTTPQAPVRMLHVGTNQPLVAQSHVETLAIAAAKANQALYEACPYPTDKPAGLHFAAIWFLHTSPTESSVYGRPPAVPSPFGAAQ